MQIWKHCLNKKIQISNVIQRRCIIQFLTVEKDFMATTLWILQIGYTSIDDEYYFRQVVRPIINKIGSNAMQYILWYKTYCSKVCCDNEILI